MAQRYSSILQASPGSFNLQPTILAPTQGDLEEARIRRLMDTAKLYNLQQEPLQNERMYNLQRAQLGETTTYHQAQIADMATGRNLEARGQDIQVRGQDLTSNAHKEALKSATANNILSHAIMRPDIPLSVYADTAKQFGFPELGVALAGHHDELLTEKAKQLATQYKIAADKGDTKTTNELLTGWKLMPDFNELSPKMKTMLPEYAKDFDLTKSGIQTTLGDYTDPEVATVRAKILVKDAAAKVEEQRMQNIRSKYKVRKSLGLTPEGKYDPTTPYTIPGYLH